MSRIMEPDNILFTWLFSRMIIFKYIFSITLETFLQIESSMKDQYIKQKHREAFLEKLAKGPGPCLLDFPLFLRLLLQQSPWD